MSLAIKSATASKHHFILRKYDINDLELMKKVGFAAIPHDGIKEAIKLADYQCRANGGRGVLREVTDLIILAKFGNKKLY